MSPSPSAPQIDPNIFLAYPMSQKIVKELMDLLVQSLQQLPCREIQVAILYLQVYWVADLAGGGVAGILYELIFATNATPEKFGGFFLVDYSDEDYDSEGRKTDPERERF